MPLRWGILGESHNRTLAEGLVRDLTCRSYGENSGKYIFLLCPEVYH